MPERRRPFVYTGLHPTHLIGYGNVRPGDRILVTTKVAAGLDDRSDFQPARKPAPTQPLGDI